MNLPMAATAAETSPKYFVFVSHAKRDAVAAEQIRVALEGCRLPCWMAPHSIPPGEHWAEAIYEGLRTCPIVVVILSEHAIRSEWVLSEMTIARYERRTVIQIRLSDVRLRGRLVRLLADLQRMDGFPPPLSDHLAAVCTAVTSAAQRVPAAPAAAKTDSTTQDLLQTILVLGNSQDSGRRFRQIFVVGSGAFFSALVLLGSIFLGLGAGRTAVVGLPLLAAGLFGDVWCYGQFQRDQRNDEQFELLRSALLQDDRPVATPLLLRLLERLKLRET